MSVNAAPQVRVLTVFKLLVEWYKAKKDSGSVSWDFSWVCQSDKSENRYPMVNIWLLYG